MARNLPPLWGAFSLPTIPHMTNNTPHVMWDIFVAASVHSCTVVSTVFSRFISYICEGCEVARNHPPFYVRGFRSPQRPKTPYTTENPVHLMYGVFGRFVCTLLCCGQYGVQQIYIICTQTRPSIADISNQIGAESISNNCLQTEHLKPKTSNHKGRREP